MAKFATCDKNPVQILVDDCDLEMVSKYKWRSRKVHINGRDYPVRIVTRIGGRQVQISRLIMKPDLGYVVDHIDGNTLDNRRLNLRVCTVAENGKNKPMYRNNQSGVKGVCWKPRHKKWRAQITVDRKVIWLGDFESINAAGKSYRDAVLVYNNKFARK